MLLPLPVSGSCTSCVSVSICNFMAIFLSLNHLGLKCIFLYFRKYDFWSHLGTLKFYSCRCDLCLIHYYTSSAKGTFVWNNSESRREFVYYWLPFILTQYSTEHTFCETNKYMCCCSFDLVFFILVSSEQTFLVKKTEVSFLASHGHKVPQSLLISETFPIVCVVVSCLLLNSNWMAQS